MNSKALVCNSRVEVRCWCGARLLAFRRGISQFSRIRFFDFFFKASQNSVDDEHLVSELSSQCHLQLNPAHLTTDTNR